MKWSRCSAAPDGEPCSPRAGTNPVVRRSRSRGVLHCAAAGVLALALSGLAACSSSDGSAGSSPSPSRGAGAALAGRSWAATEIAGSPVLAGADAAAVTAAFTGDRLSGSGGVNRYTGGYTTTAPDQIAISQVASTSMAGPEAAMAQEQAYFDALARATRYAATVDSLTLLDDEGTALVRFEVVQPASLEQTEWQALSYNNGKGGLQSLVAGSAITAVFGQDGRLAGNASVNRYSAGYTTTGDRLTIDDAIVRTEMAGPEELMRQEEAYLAALPTTATYAIDGDDLWLRDKDGAAIAHFRAR